MYRGTPCPLFWEEFLQFPCNTSRCVRRPLSLPSLLSHPHSTSTCFTWRMWYWVCVVSGPGRRLAASGTWMPSTTLLIVLNARAFGGRWRWTNGLWWTRCLPATAPMALCCVSCCKTATTLARPRWSSTSRPPRVPRAGCQQVGHRSPSPRMTTSLPAFRGPRVHVDGGSTHERLLLGAVALWAWLVEEARWGGGHEVFVTVPQHPASLQTPRLGTRSPRLAPCPSCPICGCCISQTRKRRQWLHHLTRCPPCGCVPPAPS